MKKLLLSLFMLTILTASVMAAPYTVEKFTVRAVGGNIQYIGDDLDLENIRTYFSAWGRYSSCISLDIMNNCLNGIEDNPLCDADGNGYVNIMDKLEVLKCIHGITKKPASQGSGGLRVIANDVDGKRIVLYLRLKQKTENPVFQSDQWVFIDSTASGSYWKQGEGMKRISGMDVVYGFNKVTGKLRVASSGDIEFRIDGRDISYLG